MTYELFMSAVVGDADTARARALLGGFTEMRERHHVTRVQHYEPQDTAVKGFPTIKQMQRDRRPTAQQWHELHQILVKQPFLLHVRSDITDEAEKAVDASAAAAASIPGKPSAVSVRWTDLPDPPNQQIPFVTQRRVLDIADPDAHTILAANKFKITSDTIEETYTWWLDGLEYSLMRMFQVTSNPDPATPAQQVPDLASLKPAAPFWMLIVRARVDAQPTTTMPSRMKQAQAQLVQVRERLLGVFEFKVFDRRCHDTRIQETGTAWEPRHHHRDHPQGNEGIDMQRFKIPAVLRDDLPDDPKDLTDSEESDEEEGAGQEGEEAVGRDSVDGVEQDSTDGVNQDSTDGVNQYSNIWGAIGGHGPPNSGGFYDADWEDWTDYW